MSPSRTHVPDTALDGTLPLSSVPREAPPAMTVDAARRTRRRAAPKSADQEATAAGSEPATPATQARRAGAKKAVDGDVAAASAASVESVPAPAPIPAEPAELVLHAMPTPPPAAVGMRMPNLTPPDSSVSPSSMFRSASSYAPSPAAAAAPFASSPALAIGELDQTIFDCPACSRPLALGSRRCPGCKTRLVNGVVLTKASAFAAVGLALGLLAGAGGGFLVGSSNAAVAGAAVAAAGAGASAAPSTRSSAATATPTPAPTVAPTVAAPTPPADVPGWARSAFVQVLATNGRLTTAAADLRAALTAPVFDASAVAQTLRTISADSVFAQQLADRVASWPGAGPVGPQLVDYYARVHETAATGLLASVRNGTAYRDAATKMLALIDEARSIDDAVRATATAAGLDLGEAPTAP